METTTTYYEARKELGGTVLHKAVIQSNPKDKTHIGLRFDDGIMMDCRRTDFHMEGQQLRYHEWYLALITNNTADKCSPSGSPSNKETTMETIRIADLRKEAMDKTCGYHFYVGRGSDLGNPFIMKSFSQKERVRVCDEYAAWLEQKLFGETKDKKVCQYMNTIYKAYKKHGKLVLFCYCSPKQCHAETIRDYILDPKPRKKEEPAATAEPAVKKTKVKTAKFKVYVKANYTGCPEKDKLIQVVELTHAVAKAWRKNSDWTTVILKSTCIKNHYIVEHNGVSYYFVKEV